ncbi:MAG: hypothetical protein Rhob2KO_40110 [Rhodopirellula baltica]
MTLSPVFSRHAGLVLFQHVGESARFDTSKVGGDMEVWQAPAEVRLHTFRAGEMFSVDDVQYPNLARDIQSRRMAGGRK